MYCGTESYDAELSEGEPHHGIELLITERNGRAAGQNLIN